jgi:hypothetical protein
LVAGRVDLERLRAEEATEGVQCSSDMHIEVGVDTSGHATRF